MTSISELVRATEAIIPPVGATMAIAVVDEQLKHRAAWLIEGRRRSAPVGPAFDRPRDAITFVRMLNDGPTPAPRPSLDSDLARVAGTDTARRDEGRATPEAPDGEAIPRTRGIEPATTPDLAHQAATGASTSSPDPAAAPPAAAGVRTSCAFCGDRMPAGRHGQRRVTCSAACRVARSRRPATNDTSPDVDSGVTPSAAQRPSDAVPTSSEVPGGDALPGASRDAGPRSSPGLPPVIPTLGLV